MEGIRFGEKALAERCVSLIRKGGDGKGALGELAGCLHAASTGPIAPDGADSGQLIESVGGQISQFRKQVRTCAEALLTLCGGSIRNGEAVQEVQKQRAATPGAATSITSIVNAALSTSRFWQVPLRDCLGLLVDV